MSAIVPECTTRYEASTGAVRRWVRTVGGGQTRVVRSPTGHHAARRLPEITPTIGLTCQLRLLRGTNQELRWYRRPGKDEGVHVMAIAIYAALLPICSFILGVFGFFAGRCSRKIPILDDNLPRALHRGQLPPWDS